MRIFTAVRHAKDSQFYYGGLWSNNFYPALQQLGHKVVESQTDLLPVSRFMGIASDFTYQEVELRAQVTQSIIDEARKAHKERPIDLFLSYFYNAHFDPDGFTEIHKLGIPTVNFYCNSIYQFELVAAIAPKVDFAWHTEKDARSSYLAVGANPIWVQMGADPDVYHPVAVDQRYRKACFVGQRYADRDRWVATLIRAGIPVDLYGKGWDRQSSLDNSSIGPVRQNEAVADRPLVKPGTRQAYLEVALDNIRRQGLIQGNLRTWRQFSYRRGTKKLTDVIAPYAKGYAKSVNHTFAQYEVVLNFSNVWADGRPGSGLIPHVRLRDFEAPMCRACYLTGYTDEIAEFYEIGKEIDTYQTYEELVNKTLYYLENPQKAENLRDAGYKRAIQDHTWVSRFKTLFNRIGIHLPND